MNETCNRHDDCLGRIHTEINDMNKRNFEMTGNVNAFMGTITAFVAKIDRDVYDPEKGLGSKVNAHGTQLVLQWGILVTIIVGLVAIFVKK